MARIPLFCAIFFLICGIAAIAAPKPENALRKPLIYGACKKPFPAIFNIDYPFCRAKAWLAALESASENLPQALPARFRQPNISQKLTGMAIAALICPIDVVTPERAQSDEIRVFLKWPDDPARTADALLRDPAKLYPEMAAIWETSRIAAKIASIWPDSVGRERENLAELEELGQELDLLWDFQPDKAGNFPQIKSAGLPLVPLLLGEASRDPVANLRETEKALALTLEREVADRENSGLWNSLAAEGLYLRGQALAKHEQFALAEADYTAAIARLGKAGAKIPLAARVYLARGELARSRHNTAAMCADFASACSLGLCQALSIARRAGECLEGQ